MAKPITRRALLKRSAAMAALGAGLFRAPLLWSGEAANAKLGTVLIGCGGQGSNAHLPTAARERLVAIVDADERKWASSTRLLAEKHKDIHLGTYKTYFDYRKMFDECARDIDAVFVATPNHHHALPAMIAMRLHKGVYVEKPMSHTIAEARALAAASKQFSVPTQMGNQGHCGEGYRRLCEYVWAGAIGKVTEVHCWSDRANGGVGPRPPTLPVPEGMHWDEWIGPSPFRDYHRDLHPHEWHGWYDFGNGSLGNMACHVMDGAIWALRLQWPTAVEAEQINGGTDERYPVGCRLRYDFPARGDLPPVKVFWWDGKKAGVRGDAKGDERDNVARGAQNRPPLVDELEKRYGRRLGGNGTLYIGDRGIMHSGTYGDGVRIIPEEKHKEFPPPPKSLPRTPRGASQDFLDACRSGKPTTASNFEVAAVLTEVVLLGNLAQKAGVGRKVEWDGPAMRCPNIPEVNALVQRENRRGWTV